MVIRFLSALCMVLVMSTVVCQSHESSSAESSSSHENSSVTVQHEEKKSDKLLDDTFDKAQSLLLRQSLKLAAVAGIASGGLYALGYTQVSGAAAGFFALPITMSVAAAGILLPLARKKIEAVDECQCNAIILNDESIKPERINHIRKKKTRTKMMAGIAIALAAATLAARAFVVNTWRRGCMAGTAAFLCAVPLQVWLKCQELHKEEQELAQTEVTKEKEDDDDGVSKEEFE